MSRKDRTETSVTSAKSSQLVPQELEELKPGETAVINGRTYMLIQEQEEKDNS